MTNDEIVDAYIGAFGKADVGALLDLIAPGAVIWHNFDERERDIASSMGEIGRLQSYLQNLRYDVLERFPVGDGVGVRMVLRATLSASGKEFASHQVKFFRISDGKIVRIEEYVAPSASGGKQG
jgi:ketosteroid isomerase-like protein